MSGQKVELQCDTCKAEFEILTKNYEKYVHDDDPIYCDNCFNKLMEQQQIAELPKRKQFEYIVTSCEDFVNLDQEAIAFNLYGQDGWELVQITNNKTYFKREVLKC